MSALRSFRGGLGAQASEGVNGAVFFPWTPARQALRSGLGQVSVVRQFCVAGTAEGVACHIVKHAMLLRRGVVRGGGQRLGLRLGNGGSGWRRSLGKFLSAKSSQLFRRFFSLW